MRPIAWGIIIAVIGAFLWLLSSFVLGFAAAGAGYTSVEEMPLLWQLLIYIPGLAMIFAIPVAIIIEIIRWIKGR